MKSVCLFCGSRSGLSQSHARAAEKFGSSVAQEKWRLVYGAGGIGLMGIAATAAKAAGGTVFGVIPAHLTELEIVHGELDTLVVTETMHERKKIMFMNSDAIVALPGGAGTLDELFEAITWLQLGLHEKPIFLLNVEDYWNGVLSLLGDVVRCGFAEENLTGLVRCTNSVDELIAELRESLK